MSGTFKATKPISESAVRRTMCEKCAFRKGSPEENWLRNGGLAEMRGGFMCHETMLPTEESDVHQGYFDYDPHRDRNGNACNPSDTHQICAGWAAIMHPLKDELQIDVRGHIVEEILQEGKEIPLLYSHTPKIHPEDMYCGNG
jgi:hypothetical protein